MSTTEKYLRENSSHNCWTPCSVSLENYGSLVKRYFCDSKRKTTLLEALGTDSLRGYQHAVRCLWPCFQSMQASSHCLQWRPDHFRLQITSPVCSCTHSNVALLCQCKPVSVPHYSLPRCSLKSPFHRGGTEPLSKGTSLGKKQPSGFTPAIFPGTSTVYSRIESPR